MKEFIQRIFGGKKQTSEESDFALVLGARQLHRQGNLDGAIQLAKKYLSKHPKNLDMRKILGDFYIELERYDDALIEYQTVLDLDTNYSGYKDLCAGMAFAHYYKEDFDKAKIEFQTALEESPRDPNLRFFLARCFFKLEKYEEAICEYAMCEPFHSDKALIRFGMGEAYFLQGNIEKAIEEFQRSIEIAPDEGEIHFNLAKCYEKLGNRELANREFQIAKKLGY